MCFVIVVGVVLFKSNWKSQDMFWRQRETQVERTGFRDWWWGSICCSVPTFSSFTFSLSQFCIKYEGLTSRVLDPILSHLLKDVRSPAVASFLFCITDFFICTGPFPPGYKNDLL